MKKEVNVCDFCQQPCNYNCEVCGKDICGAHMMHYGYSTAGCGKCGGVSGIDLRRYGSYANHLTLCLNCAKPLKRPSLYTKKDLLKLYHFLAGD